MCRWREEKDLKVWLHFIQAQAGVNYCVEAEEVSCGKRYEDREHGVLHPFGIMSDKPCSQLKQA